ncbi:MAG TPA: YceI family protein [Solirubrobacteraceae bacterium]|nr:YceI family protein [Solirubrobacteraceae bacterium]
MTIKTGREGAGAKMGHDLTLEATSWDGTLEIGDNNSVQLNVDPSSIEVVSGTGGAKPLGDKDKGDIKKSITGKVLGSSQISFKSSDVQADNGSLNVKGDLSVAGGSDSVNIPCTVSDDGTVRGSIKLSQSAFGIKQFKALMGALKVSDQVEVQIEAKLPTA